MNKIIRGKKKFYAAVGLCTLMGHAYANAEVSHPFYVGALGGVGSTTWDGLVPTEANQSIAMRMSTPTHTDEGGGVWGFWAGYEITPYFAIEADYLRYPGAKVVFDCDSIFTYDHLGQDNFVTSTDALSLLAKVQLLIPDTKIRLFSAAGIGDVHRKDMLVNDWNLGASFALGVNFRVTEHTLAEIAGNYTSGYGESRLIPSDSFIPFLYAVTFKLAYAF